MRDALSFLVLAAALGCAPKAAPAACGCAGGELASSPVVASSPRAPLTVELVPQGESAGRLTLLARVNRNAPIRVSTAVTVTVPAGARLVSGRASWVIEGSEATGPVEETLVFDVAGAGPGEILLAADAEGPDFGVHAKKAHAIGAAAQKAAPPERPGPRLEVGGHDFGPSVPARP